LFSYFHIILFNFSSFNNDSNVFTLTNSSTISTEFMLQYMQDVANISLDEVIDWLINNK